MISKFSSKVKYIIVISALLIMILNTFALATSSTTDVTPPRGKLEIKNIIQINNVNYVDTAEIEVEINAKDDICADSEIKYYISTSQISDSTEIAENDWKTYSLGITEKLTLPNLNGSNTIYVVFKDATGNTSLIYSGTNVQYTIAYDKNADDAVDISSTVATTAYYGMSFIVTMQTPTRDNYYFAGWSTSPTATTASYAKGEIIPADVFSGGSKTITLYAVWKQSANGLVLLSDVAEIGDYVSYPVSYDNVVTLSSYTSSYNGWRVISKDVDLDGNSSPGTINIVSAGCPLSYYHSSNSSTSITNLTTNFLTTTLNESGTNTYRKTGFLPYKTLTETFTNKFTAMKSDGVTPQVRAMKAEDIYRVTGHTSMSTGTTMGLNNAGYEQLFANGAYYWLASADSSSYLWRVRDDGFVYYNGYSEYGVRPVVSLKSGIVVTGTDKVGAWNIEVAE